MAGSLRAALTGLGRTGTVRIPAVVTIRHAADDLVAESQDLSVLGPVTHGQKAK